MCGAELHVRPHAIEMKLEKIESKELNVGPRTRRSSVLPPYQNNWMVLDTTCSCVYADTTQELNIFNPIFFPNW